MEPVALVRRRGKSVYEAPRTFFLHRAVDGESSIASRVARVPLLFALVAAILGCQKSDGIRTYTTPKEPKAELAKPSTVKEPALEPTDRMLVAVYPAGDQAYFFKIVGPIAAIDKLEKPLSDFFAAVRIGDDGKPKWELPTDWKDAPGNAMRLATILVPSDPRSLELTLNMSRWDGSADDKLLNINRWRGQLKLPPTTPEKVAEYARETKAGELTITIVDLRGNYAGGMLPPFAGGGTPPFAGGQSASPAVPIPAAGESAGLPPGHPPIDDSASLPPSTNPPVPTANTPTFTTPADWKQLPSGGMRKAAFRIGDEQQNAIVTLIDFPTDAGEMIGDALPNVNRWRREVGLNELKQDELATGSESIEIGGQPATFVRAVPDPSQADQSKADKATLAAMVKSDDKIWFIKLTGDRAVVVSQEESFKSFLKSLRFTSGS